MKSYKKSDFKNPQDFLTVPTRKSLTNSLIMFNFYFLYFEGSQCKAFSLKEEDNYEKYLESPHTIRTFHSRCVNHLLQQSISDFVTSCSFIKALEKKLSTQLIEINSNYKHRTSMGSRAPVDLKSKWYKRTEAADYIRKKYEEYFFIFGSQSITLENICLYGLLFEACVGFNRLAEKNCTSLPGILSLDLQFFQYLHNLLGLNMVLIKINI
jgi:hypothetical protein